MAGDWVFGFGSLGAEPDGHPAWLRRHRRRWGVAMDNRATIPGYKFYRAPDGSRPAVFVAFLDLEPDPAAAGVNGVLLPASADRLRALDARERSYTRTDVTADAEGAPGRVWAYVGREAARARLRAARTSRVAVVHREYVERVEAAFAARGDEALQAFHATTEPAGLPLRTLRLIGVPADADGGARGARRPGYDPPMGLLQGTAAAEIAAPLERCYEVAADLEHIAEWQGGVEHVAVLERDAQGRPTLIEIATDAKVRTVKSKVRFRYDAPDGLSWTQEKGDLKSVEGAWRFEAAGAGRTRATYELAADPGRVLGMLIRGPVEDKLRDILVGERPDELRRRVAG